MAHEPSARAGVRTTLTGDDGAPYISGWVRYNPRPARVDMALLITSDCIECCACEPECPNEAIRLRAQVFVVDPDRCTECVGFHEEAACQRVCPVECCLPDPAHPETEEKLIRKAVRLHPDDIALAARAKSNDFPSRYRSDHER